MTPAGGYTRAEFSGSRPITLFQRATETRPIRRLLIANRGEIAVHHPVHFAIARRGGTARLS